MWYPVQGNNRRRLAPDAMVVFGRPKGDRPSYIQHKEGGIGPQVAFEVLSPGNRKRVMDYKRTIYERYGVDEYYVFDPYKIKLEVWLREGNAFRRLPEAETSGWISPRLGVRFELGDDLTILHPNGRPFESYQEVDRRAEDERLRAEEERATAEQERTRADEERLRAEQERLRAEQERLRAEEERATAEQERTRAEQERLRALEARARAEEERLRADDERLRADEASSRAERLAAKLRGAGAGP